MATKTGGRVASVNVEWVLERRAQVPPLSFAKLAELHVPKVSQAAIHAAIKGRDPAPKVSTTRLLPWTLPAEYSDCPTAQICRCIVREFNGEVLSNRDRGRVDPFKARARELVGTDNWVVYWNPENRTWGYRVRHKMETVVAKHLAYKP